jgi:predicted transcriptional regulator
MSDNDVKIYIGFSSDAVEAIDQIAERTSRSRVEVVRRALALYMLVDEEILEEPLKRRVSITKGRKILSTFVID